ncbi:oleate hydratase [Oxalobacteraceae bacterium GrIS 1.11]
MAKAYLVGSGIASLSAAVYMLRDAHMAGSDISIFEYSHQLGGSLDAEGNAQDGYLCRGTRGFDFQAYPCLQDVLASIPALDAPGKSLNQQIHAFGDDFTIDTKTRLMAQGKSVPVISYGVGMRDQLAITRLLLGSEASLKDRPISDFFSEEFFATPFWWMFSTIFAFARWHSAQEMRRYLHTFIQNVQDMDSLHSIRSTVSNNQEGIVRPMVDYLRQQGVSFVMDTEVVDIGFASDARDTIVQSLICRQGGKQVEIKVEDDDVVFVTLGSIAAPFDSGAWRLWHTIAQGRDDFGRPALFTSHSDQSTMTTCTITLNDPEVYDMLRTLLQQEPDVNRLTTFIDSPWSLSLIVPKQPWFANQGPDTKVLWCYGIWPKGIGKFVAKRMEDCSPDEILTELFSLLGFDDIARLVEKTIGRKSVLPAGHAQFLCRNPGDRPEVIPEGSRNLAFLGQYVESEGTTYTMEYSVRTAQKAVYQLFNIEKPMTPTYHGAFHPETLLRAARAFMR